MNSISFSKKNKTRVLNALENRLSVKKLTSEELHQFVRNYNYDNGIEPLKWIISQKHCDKGTALCLYWHLEPAYYYNNEVATLTGLNEEFHLSKEIEERYLKGFYEQELFSFEPYREFLNESICVNGIPAAMLKKTNGIVFDRLNVEFAFLRYPNKKELKSIDAKIKNSISIIKLLSPDFSYSNPSTTVEEIVKAVEYWKNKELEKIRINNLSYLWLDCLVKQYHWEWIMWDWETGRKAGVSNKLKNMTCMQDGIIRFTIDGLFPAKNISKLFQNLDGVEHMVELEKNPFSGVGVLFETSHLAFQTP